MAFSLISQDLLCSNSYSYQLNYQFHSKLYNKLDKKTEEVEWLRLPVFLIHNISAATTVAARITGIAETFFKGFGMLLLSPFTSTPCDQAEKGLEEMVIHTSKNLMRLAYFPVEYLVDSLEMAMEPKFFVIDKLKYSNVHLKHALTRTLGSVEHGKELMGLGGIVNATFLAYQRRRFERLRKNEPTD